MADTKQIDWGAIADAALSSNWSGLIILAAGLWGLLWLSRSGFLAWSASRVQASSDAGSLAVLQSLRDEITRLQVKNEQLDKQVDVLDKQVEAEKAACAARLEVMNETISKLRERVAILEAK